MIRGLHAREVAESPITLSTEAAARQYGMRTRTEIKNVEDWNDRRFENDLLTHPTYLPHQGVSEFTG